MDSNGANARARIGRILRRILVVAAVLVGANLTVPPPASAALDWKTFNWTSTTHCSDDNKWQISGIVVYYCVVVNGNYTQVLIKVSNNSGHTQPIYVTAHSLQLIENTNVVYERNCLETEVRPGESLACVGPTTWRSCSSYVQAWGRISILAPVGIRWYDTQYSPTRKMCS